MGKKIALQLISLGSRVKTHQVVFIICSHLLFIMVGLLVWFHNHSLFFLINYGGRPIVDLGMGMLTHFGDGIVWVLIFLLLAIIQPKKGVTGFTTLFILLVVVYILKEIFQVDRPAAVFEQVEIIGPEYRHGGFPSGHTATIFAATLLLVRWLGPIAFPLYILAFFSGLSRIYVGAHFPLDVFVGGYVGVLTGYIGLIIAPEFLVLNRLRSHHPLLYTFTILTLVQFVGLYMVFLHDPARQAPLFYTLLYFMIATISLASIFYVTYCVVIKKKSKTVCTPGKGVSVNFNHKKDIQEGCYELH